MTPTTNNEFYVYVSHSNASSGSAGASLRLGEAQIIRNDESTNCPANARVLYVGDFNLYNSWEPAYLTMLSNTAPNGVSQGGGIDPLNVLGATNIDWGDPTTNPAIVFMIDESADHLAYRCELQYMTSNVYYDVLGGLQYVPSTHHCFGNNASAALRQFRDRHRESALNDLDPVLTNRFNLPATTLYVDLTNTTDHLPVVADYTIPVPLTIPVACFTANPSYGVAPLTVNFMDISTGSAHELDMDGYQRRHVDEQERVVHVREPGHLHSAVDRLQCQRVRHQHAKRYRHHAVPGLAERVLQRRHPECTSRAEC